MEKEAENPITTELVKNNVTDAVLKNLKVKYLPLKINGVDDKEGYDTVHKARMVCRDLRVLTEKLCKKGREDAVKIQKAWIQKEKEVVAEISEVEQHLKKQEDAVDAEIEARKIRAERLLKLPGRKEQIAGIEDYVLTVIQSSLLLKSYPLPESLTDEVLMIFDDTIWNQVLINAKDRKIQDFEEKERIKKNQERQDRIVTRTNLLFRAGAIKQLNAQGLQVFSKAGQSVAEFQIADMEDKEWEKTLTEFKLVPDEFARPEEAAQYPKTPSESYSAPVKEEPKEISDEEKLWNFAKILEGLVCPVLNTEGGKRTFKEAERKIIEAIEILKK